MKFSTSPVILYSDNRWLVVDKPYGIATHGGDVGDLALQEWIELHFGIKTFVCSRLDKGTTGVLIFARTPEASSLAERIHIEESSQKVYYFLSDKDVSHTHGLSWQCALPLDGKPARTLFSYEKRLSKNVFLYKAQITRGRTHQIRRHAAESGCPLWGDVDYGGCTAPRIALHCAQLFWPDIAEPVCSPLPESFLEQTHDSGKTSLELAVALERRGQWIASVTSAWRVVQRGELTDFDISIDIYEKHALVWVYDVTDANVMSSALAPLFTSLRARYGIVGHVYRRISKNPHKKGLVQEVWSEGEMPPEIFAVREHSWQAWGTLTLRQHVGLFLDHRDNRRRVEINANGKRVANLFSYTCAFALAATKGGAEVVVNVDASASTLSVGKKNVELNALSEARVSKFVERDVRLWLDKQVQKMEHGDDPGWDIIVCDPPTFSSTHEAGPFQVVDAWEDLARSCSLILKHDGVCYFSTNSQGHERVTFETQLKRFFKTVLRLKPPMDFPDIAGRSHARFYECRKT